MNLCRVPQFTPRIYLLNCIIQWLLSRWIHCQWHWQVEGAAQAVFAYPGIRVVAVDSEYP